MPSPDEQSSVPGTSPSGPLAPAGSTPAPPSAQDAFWQALVKFVETWPVVGRPLAHLIGVFRFRAVFALLLLLWTFLIYPLLLPWLAALAINRGLLGDAQRGYTETVRNAFHAHELAAEALSENNRRLDYYQVLDHKGPAIERFSYTLTAEPYQRLRFRLSKARLIESPASCRDSARFDPQGTQLYELLLGDEKFGTLTNEDQGQVIQIGAEIWSKVKDKATDGKILFTVAPVPALAEILNKSECSNLVSQYMLAIEVFKDKVNEPAKVLAQAG